MFDRAYINEGSSINVNVGFENEVNYDKAKYPSNVYNWACSLSMNVIPTIENESFIS